MSLGLTYSQAIPRMIESNSAALVQNIRNIGKQVEGHLTEIQTRRDLGRMAQEIQTLNTQSDQFPNELAGLASRHPLALQDQRGMMALQVLGKAHTDWRQAQEATTKFGRDLELAKFRGDNTLGAIYTRGEVQKQVDEARQRGRLELQDEVLSGRKTIEQIRAENQASLLQQRGEQRQTMSAAEKERIGMQRQNQARQMQKDQRSAIEREMDDLDSSFKADEARRDGLAKQLRDSSMSGPQAEAVRKELTDTITAIEQRAEEKKKRRAELFLKKKAIDETPLEVFVPVEDASVLPVAPASLAEASAGNRPTELPPVPAGAAEAPVVVNVAPPTDELVLVFDPNGKPGKVRASQLDAALQNGYKRR